MMRNIQDGIDGLQSKIEASATRAYDRHGDVKSSQQLEGHFLLPRVRLQIKFEEALEDEALFVPRICRKP